MNIKIYQFSEVKPLDLGFEGSFVNQIKAVAELLVHVENDAILPLLHYLQGYTTN